MDWTAVALSLLFFCVILARAVAPTAAPTFAPTCEPFVAVLECAWTGQPSRCHCCSSVLSLHVQLHQLLRPPSPQHVSHLWPCSSVHGLDSRRAVTVVLLCYPCTCSCTNCCAHLRPNM